jgi:hypothetical protein
MILVCPPPGNPLQGSDLLRWLLLHLQLITL